MNPYSTLDYSMQVNLERNHWYNNSSGLFQQSKKYHQDKVLLFQLKGNICMNLHLSLLLVPPFYLKPKITHWSRDKLLLFEMCQEVWGYPVDHCHLGNHPQCSVKSQSSGFLKKIIFLIFWSSKSPFFKVFWALMIFYTPIPFLASKLMILKGSDLKQLLIWEYF